MSRIHIEKRGKRIEIHSQIPLPGLKTTIPGAYHAANGHWTVPCNLETCKLLREKYGKQLRIGSELSRWAKGVRASRDYMAELAASEDAELEILPKAAPKLAKAMNARKYQRVGARFIADNHATLVADEPGLGKTLIALGGILEAQIPGPYLIIAPKTASKNVWEREIKRWLPTRHRPITLPELRQARERKLRLTLFNEFKWLIVHPEILLAQTWHVCHICGHHTQLKNRRQKMLDCKHLKTPRTKKTDTFNYPILFDIEWGAIVVDESHESLIRRSGTPTQRRNGLDKLKLRGDGIRIAMSGTPMNNKAPQLWGTLNWLDSKTYGAFHRWSELYWHKGGYTGFDTGEFRKERELMLWDSLSSIAIRRTKQEVAKDLPPKLEIGTPLNPSDESSPKGIWLEMEGAQAKAYEQMLKYSMAELDSGQLDAITPLAELTRLKQLACSYGDITMKQIEVVCYSNKYSILCSSCRKRGYHTEYRYKYIPQLPSNKFNWLVENLEEWGYPANPLTKVIIVSFYTGLLEMVAQNLEKYFKSRPNYPLTTAITGKVKSNRRDQIIQRFNQDGGPQIMMLNVKAGGTAITIDTADRMVFLSETRIPDQQTQAEDRIHRVSNPRQCMYYYLRSLGTVDVGTAITNQELAKESHRLLDERRGIDYVRHVIEMSK
jgi:SNF2 family DNA or RNA helicase